MMEDMSEYLKRESGQPTLPKLISLDWRVDLQVASSETGGAGREPTALL
jgi:hypothetical protein